MATITAQVPLACDQRGTTTSSSSNESSKKSLPECIVIALAQPNTPESNISGLDRAVKEQARPLFMGIFAHRFDVSFLQNKKVGIRQKNNLKRRPIFAILLVTLH
ncbi:MAG: hypothetical protein K6G32_00390 [Prevotella sp.]|nr:hypothetical protein [Prevotella sp.]